MRRELVLFHRRCYFYHFYQIMQINLFKTINEENKI
jgi:hypothetical protein